MDCTPTTNYVLQSTTEGPRYIRYSTYPIDDNYPWSYTVEGRVLGGKVVSFFTARDGSEETRPSDCSSANAEQRRRTDVQRLPTLPYDTHDDRGLGKLLPAVEKGAWIVISSPDIVEEMNHPVIINALGILYPSAPFLILQREISEEEYEIYMHHNRHSVTDPESRLRLEVGENENYLYSFSTQSVLDAL